MVIYLQSSIRLHDAMPNIAQKYVFITWCLIKHRGGSSWRGSLVGNATNLYLLFVRVGIKSCYRQRMLRPIETLPASL
jgi:hypothetical protein